MEGAADLGALGAPRGLMRYKCGTNRESMREGDESACKPEIAVSISERGYACNPLPYIGKSGHLRNLAFRGRAVQNLGAAWAGTASG